MTIGVPLVGLSASANVVAVFKLKSSPNQIERLPRIGTGGKPPVAPGVVQSLSVKVGDRVTSGQTVLVLEAMKMQVQIGAPTAGRVQSISVQPGDQVTTGQILAHLEAT